MVQMRAVDLARDKARPVIVATRMLESMISAPRPTEGRGVGRGQRVVAGSPPGTPGKTNALRVHRIGDAVASGV